jgi:hypothetical protein
MLRVVCFLLRRVNCNLALPKVPEEFVQQFAGLDERRLCLVPNPATPLSETALDPLCYALLLSGRLVVETLTSRTEANSSLSLLLHSLWESDSVGPVNSGPPESASNLWFWLSP